MNKKFLYQLYELLREYKESCVGYYEKPEVEPTFQGFMKFVADKIPFDYKLK